LFSDDTIYNIYINIYGRKSHAAGGGGAFFVVLLEGRRERGTIKNKLYNI
jgi:hypothetical protein